MFFLVILSRRVCLNDINILTWHLFRNWRTKTERKVQHQNLLAAVTTVFVLDSHTVTKSVIGTFVSVES